VTWSSLFGGERAEQPASLFSRRTLSFAATALSVIALDRWTKQLATEHLLDSGARSVPLIGEYIRLTYVENRGAAFGVLQDQTAFFILVGLVVISVIVASYRYIPEPSWLLNLCLGLQMGGAIGNLIDRMRLGYVIDFVDAYLGPHHWPAFNVADSAISVGVALLILDMLWHPQSHPDAPEKRAASGVPAASPGGE
jgi:signal peptidase II